MTQHTKKFEDSQRLPKVCSIFSRDSIAPITRYDKKSLCHNSCLKVQVQSEQQFPIVSFSIRSRQIQPKSSPTSNTQLDFRVIRQSVLINPSDAYLNCTVSHNLYVSYYDEKISKINRTPHPNDDYVKNMMSWTIFLPTRLIILNLPSSLSRIVWKSMNSFHLKKKD